MIATSHYWIAIVFVAINTGYGFYRFGYSRARERYYRPLPKRKGFWG